MKIGDVSRRRRFADPVRLRWYAYHRAIRFSRRMMTRTCTQVESNLSTLLVSSSVPTTHH